MEKALIDFTPSEQSDLLLVAGRLLALWVRSGKTSVPEGFGTLFNFAMHTAILTVDFIDEQEYPEASEGDV